jgi:hypothetical protein
LTNVVDSTYDECSQEYKEKDHAPNIVAITVGNWF